MDNDSDDDRRMILDNTVVNGVELGEVENRPVKKDGYFVQKSQPADDLQLSESDSEQELEKDAPSKSQAQACAVQKSNLVASLRNRFVKSNASSSALTSSVSAAVAHIQLARNDCRGPRSPKPKRQRFEYTPINGEVDENAPETAKDVGVLVHEQAGSAVGLIKQELGNATSLRNRFVRSNAKSSALTSSVTAAVAHIQSGVGSRRSPRYSQPNPQKAGNTIIKIEVEEEPLEAAKYVSEHEQSAGSAGLIKQEVEPQSSSRVANARALMSASAVNSTCSRKRKSVSAFANNVDNDSDDDKLVIVDDPIVDGNEPDEDRLVIADDSTEEQKTVKVNNRPVKKEEQLAQESQAVNDLRLSESDSDQERERVAPPSKKRRPARPQQKSDVPDSLKNRFVRSKARSSALTSSVTTAVAQLPAARACRRAPRAPKPKPPKAGYTPIKLEVDVEAPEEAKGVRERCGRAVRPIKQEAGGPAFANGVDSDSDDDRLVIVDDPVVDDTPRELEKITAGGQQRKSLLPDSLKNRFVRSKVRSSALTSSVSTTAATQSQSVRGGRRAPRAPKPKPQKVGFTPVKVEVDVETPEAVGDVHDRAGRDARLIKKEDESSETPLRVGKAGTLMSTSAVNSICGRKTVFTHPRLRSGARVAQLIDVTEAISLQKPKAKRAPRKPRLTLPEVPRESKKKAPPPVRVPRPRVAQAQRKRVIKKEQDEDSQLAKEGIQPELSKIDSDEVDYVKTIMEELGWNEKPKRRARKATTTNKKDEKVVKCENEQAEKENEEDDSICLEAVDKSEETDLEETQCAAFTKIEVEEVRPRLSRASRRKLTRSLLRECNSIPLRAPRRKTAAAAPFRRRMPRINWDEDVGSNDVETFDTFLKYPKDIVYPKTIEEFCTAPDEQCKSFYEDYMLNVRGDGIPIPDVGRRLAEKAEFLEKEIARLKKIKSKLEQEDRLLAEPFLDYIAYRLHPLHTRGETRRLFGIHPLKLQANTCALSDSAAMWCVRKASFVPLFREKREFDDFSAYLDSISGAREALHGTAEVDPEYMKIIQGKIDDVNRYLDELRSGRLSQFDKVIKEEHIECDYGTHSGDFLCDELKFESPFFGEDCHMGGLVDEEFVSFW